MPASLDHLDAATPMGATLVGNGATFRVWAPNALAVYVYGDFNDHRIDDSSLLTRDANGHWRGFIAGVREHDCYLYHVVGRGSSGPKRDPYAKELDNFPGECVVRADAFPWHEVGYRTPAFADFVIYQLHVGTFHTPRLPAAGGSFLDVALKLPHLAALGITALQLLPIQEFNTQFSQGYNGTDYFSPEMNFGVARAELAPYVVALNALLAAHGLEPYAARDLDGEIAQLKALVDLSHVHGIAVLFDVVYNHAGGDFGDESLYFFDRQPTEGGNGCSLYFTAVGHAGGLVFDYAKDEVRDFLIQNARYLLEAYRIDGFRFDQVSVIDRDGAPHGWRFCRDLTSTLRWLRPDALLHAEYWPVNPTVVAPVWQGGAGFDTTLTDGLRIAIRDAVAAASHPDERPLPMTALGASLWPSCFTDHWRFVQGPENHDIVLAGREPRIAKLGQPDDPRSWWARSRARVATGIALTAPGIPMLFMGQEFLEDKPWSDDLAHHPELLPYWAGLERGDRQMLDHLRFTSELIALRKRLPALRGQGLHIVHAHDENRVLAFQRWVEGEGHDVLVVVHLGNAHRDGYRIGLPAGGRWLEVFNSDVYENWVNPQPHGNGGAVDAEPWPLHGLAWSAPLTLPANGLLVFTR